MPRKNRITPFGEIVASEARGTLMGNRGCLHDKPGHVNKVWARRAWVTCLLDCNGRQRRIMSPGEYTELFFLDEATALSADHRPCVGCQKDRYKQFKALWLEANGHLIKTMSGGIGDIDQLLRTERCAIQELHERPTMALGELPDGCFIVMTPGSEKAFLYWEGNLHESSQYGYCEGHGDNPAEIVRVLTPMSIVRMFRDSASPSVHADIDTMSTPVAEIDPEVEIGLPLNALVPDLEARLGLEGPDVEQTGFKITQLSYLRKAKTGTSTALGLSGSCIDRRLIGVRRGWRGHRAAVQGSKLQFWTFTGICWQTKLALALGGAGPCQISNYLPRLIVACLCKLSCRQASCKSTMKGEPCV